MKHPITPINPPFGIWQHLFYMPWEMKVLFTRISSHALVLIFVIIGIMGSLPGHMIGDEEILIALMIISYPSLHCFFITYAIVKRSQTMLNLSLFLSIISLVISFLVLCVSYSGFIYGGLQNMKTIAEFVIAGLFFIFWLIVGLDVPMFVRLDYNKYTKQNCPNCQSKQVYADFRPYAKICSSCRHEWIERPSIR